jgi:hypothetical protein
MLFSVYVLLGNPTGWFRQAAMEPCGFGTPRQVRRLACLPALLQGSQLLHVVQINPQRSLWLGETSTFLTQAAMR